MEPDGILNGSKKIDLKTIAIEPATIRVFKSSLNEFLPLLFETLINLTPENVFNNNVYLMHHLN